MCLQKKQGGTSKVPFEKHEIAQSSHRAEASCEFVVISMASWTDFCSESRVRWSTGSTDWMSMDVMTRLLAGKTKRSRTFILSSKPNTDERMILAEFWTETDSGGRLVSERETKSTHKKI